MHFSFCNYSFPWDAPASGTEIVDFYFKVTLAWSSFVSVLSYQLVYATRLSYDLQLIFIAALSAVD